MNICHAIGSIVVKQAMDMQEDTGQVARMAGMIAGKLRDSGTSPDILSQLKRELEEFNIRTGTWDAPDWTEGEYTQGGLTL